MKNLEDGQVVGGEFRVGKLLSSGTYGFVYLGERLANGEDVVIKSLRGDAHTYDPSATDRFVQEASVAARLHHPNIVRIMSVGRTRGGVLYMVMERLHGFTLAKAIGGAGMGQDVVRMVACDVLRGLDFAHQHHVVHRDLKPSNLFLCDPKLSGRADGVPVIKLIDFGFVKILDDPSSVSDPGLTLQGHIIGTPGYVAPEILAGREVTAKADLYGLGVILYELLTGTQAFPGVAMERLAAQLRTTPAPPAAEIRALPIWMPIRHMLRTDPSMRPDSAAAVLREFEAL